MDIRNKIGNFFGGIAQLILAVGALAISVYVPMPGFLEGQPDQIVRRAVWIAAFLALNLLSGVLSKNPGYIGAKRWAFWVVLIAGAASFFSSPILTFIEGLR